MLKIIVMCGLAVNLISPLQAQFSWDMERKNLQVFSDSISADDLKREMIAFSTSLGVRCNHCHDDSKGKKLEQIDFASDAKPQKKIAREMIKMTRLINDRFIGEVRRHDPQATGVACMTCHRGYKEPKHLYLVLLESYEEQGLEAALDKYGELRKRYYGGFTFDFGEGSLNYFGYRVMEQSVGDALAVFKLNAKFYPQSANVHDSLGEAYLASGDSSNARVHYNKSLQLNPKNKNAIKVLRTLR